MTRNRPTRFEYQQLQAVPWAAQQAAMNADHRSMAWCGPMPMPAAVGYIIYNTVVHTSVWSRIDRKLLKLVMVMVTTEAAAAAALLQINGGGGGGSGGGGCCTIMTCTTEGNEQQRLHVYELSVEIHHDSHATS
ncbi:hypothetical protein PoB_007473700 [Plakobranchus ocellatus]|uniref:Uncharacterized protein n=1 Tax=Plakobranchus ocellatus TaxID=259542 RepID=A0AAV4DW50_9GAST|nr:hypothetical protein PoB_007473700 [Plakobranchus ocellatus]